MVDSKEKKKFMERQYKKLEEVDTFVPLEEAGECSCGEDCSCGGDCCCD